MHLNSQLSTIAILSMFLCGNPLEAAVPQQLNHQGVVSVNGQRFTGIGTFYFALKGNGGEGTNLWTNDGTEIGMSNRPTTGAVISVAQGVYSASLGGGVMVPIQANVFNNSSIVLRVWFDDGINGVQQLSPDQELSTVPFAAVANNTALLEGRTSIEIVPIGTIQAWHKTMAGTPTLPNGWVECNGQMLNDPESPYHNAAIPDLNNARCPSDGSAICYSSGSFLRGGLVSGDWQDATHIKGHGPNWPRYNWDPGSDQTDRYIPVAPVWGVHSGPQSGPQLYSDGSLAAVRPVNMSVVWIMRVK